MQEEQFGKGGLMVERDNTIAQASDVMQDVSPFDWSIGFNIEDKVGKIKVKNQFSAGSCGGEAGSYLVGILDSLRDKQPYQEKSARYLYAPCAVAGGGSSEPSLINRIMTDGVANESMVTSYKADGTTDESFMTNMSDIDLLDNLNAYEDKGARPLYLDSMNFDQLACIIRDNGAIVIGIRGYNNGTWLSAFPQAPNIDLLSQCWGHWVMVGRAKMINGKKYLGFCNSWGETVGENGWQWINEEWLPFLFCKWSIVLDTPANLSSFKTDLQIGSKGVEVAKLQKKLQDLGFFPKTQVITDYFGNVTKQAVISFQKANKIIPSIGYVGNKTRSKLNTLILKETMTNLVTSSDGTGNISTTIKGLSGGILTYIVYILHTKGVNITLEQVTIVISSILTIYGILKKVYYASKR